MSRSQDLLAALLGASAGGSPAEPPSVDGVPGLGIPGVSGVPRGRSWDAAVSVEAPGLTGDAVTFVALEDGSLVTGEDLPEGSLAPLADAIEETISPPYRAAAVRKTATLWSAAAETVAIVELRDVEGEVVELTVFEGARELSVDGQPATRGIPALEALIEDEGDVALHAERVDGSLFAVDVFSL